MQCSLIYVLGTLLLSAASSTLVEDVKKHHHHHHHKHGHHHHNHKPPTGNSSSVATAKPKTVVVASPEKNAAVNLANVAAKKSAAKTGHAEEQIVSKMKKLESELATQERKTQSLVQQGHLDVNGPLPADFSERFANAAAQATECDPNEVKIVSTSHDDKTNLDLLVFEAPEPVVKAIEHQAADPESKLANGPMRTFLIAKGSDTPAGQAAAVVEADASPHVMGKAEGEQTPVRTKGIDVDTEMPYGELEPFGREDTAQELTEQSINESDEMVDQLERAEVAEEKRAVFRALTRLRGAAITSYDGVARSQTGNIDEYNKIHKWRRTHPLHHLADEESDVSKWAFPDNADF